MKAIKLEDINFELHSVSEPISTGANASEIALLRYNDMHSYFGKIIEELVFSSECIGFNPVIVRDEIKEVKQDRLNYIAKTKVN